MSWKLKYYGHLNHRSDLEQIVMKGMALGARAKSPSTQVQTQDIKGILGIKIYEAGELAKYCIPLFYKELATS